MRLGLIFTVVLMSPGRLCAQSSPVAAATRLDLLRPGMAESEVRASKLCTGIQEIHPGRIDCQGFMWQGLPGKVWLDIENGKVVRLEITLAIGRSRTEAERSLAGVLYALRSSYGPLGSFSGASEPTAAGMLDKVDRDGARTPSTNIASGSVHPVQSVTGFSVAVMAIRSKERVYFARLNLYR